MGWRGGDNRRGRLRVALGATPATVSRMEPDRDTQQRVLPTPLFASFVGRARPGDRRDPDPQRRAAAWAQWAVEHVVEMRGVGDRSYPALVLDARFHDPGGRGPAVRPHLELPDWLLQRRDPEFPDRLAQAGNALEFPTWLLPEVLAARRVLLRNPPTPITAAVELLNTRRGDLADALRAGMRQVAPRWETVQRALVAAPDGLADVVTGDFSADEVADYFPAAADAQLEVRFDAKLRRSQAGGASRRLGVWRVRGSGDDGAFAFGVLTPRLTTNSLFRDRLFDAATESPAALLVRGLVLRRVARAHTDGEVDWLVGESETPSRGGPYLRAVVARVGAKIPEASVPAAVHFLQTHPDPQAAWEALSRWAGTRYLLTCSQEGFEAAHRNARRALRRAEEPDRDDINVVLPIAWDERSRVVRVTFSRPPDDGDDAG